MLLELACLLPSLAIHVVLVSPWVPSALDCKSALFGAKVPAGCSAASSSGAFDGQQVGTSLTQLDSGIMVHSRVQSFTLSYCCCCAG